MVTPRLPIRRAPTEAGGAFSSFIILNDYYTPLKVSAAIGATRELVV
jgi:hypothetical protein